MDIFVSYHNIVLLSSQETKKFTENITSITQPGGAGGSEGGKKYKSSQSLHELGLDNYPNPEWPEGPRLNRKEEKTALQNLNNRLASECCSCPFLDSHTTQIIVFVVHLHATSKGGI